jgi:hypothetical protein
VSYDRATMTHEPLNGSCSCGRNEYTIQIPDDVADHAQIYFDTGRDSREYIVETLVLMSRANGIL